MRARRERVFRITVNGREQWTEKADGRTSLETQHRLATQVHVGCSVRVQELYLGGAKARLVAVEEDEDDGT